MGRLSNLRDIARNETQTRRIAVANRLAYDAFGNPWVKNNSAEYASQSLATVQPTALAGAELMVTGSRCLFGRAARISRGRKKSTVPLHCPGVQSRCGPTQPPQCRYEVPCGCQLGEEPIEYEPGEFNPDRYGCMDATSR